ncbi:MAG: hypothetical protein CL789_04405 [Chloroflexi bacterium]|nr:hypothetical protein [Chloroflexota bacterium]HCU79873.1 hypothetical protein [Chloroflexota bacterium]|tara:strand:+ start:930 stop:1619 length:690 start_codon:yes stop_codon:yes gene_type:complete
MSKRAQNRVEQQGKKRRQRFISVMVITIAVVLVAILIIRQSNQDAVEIVSVDKETPAYADGKALGSMGAPVLVQSFSNFPCPHCRTLARDAASQIESNFVESGLVRYEYHYATFDQSVGRFAAEAAECANQQGAFWPYHDILYANQTGVRDQYSERRLIAFAEDLDLDGREFRSCLDEGRSSAVVQQDAELASEMGVNATPTVFINGEKVEGSMPFEVYREIIERELDG